MLRFSTSEVAYFASSKIFDIELKRINMNCVNRVVFTAKHSDRVSYWPRHRKRRAVNIQYLPLDVRKAYNLCAGAILAACSPNLHLLIYNGRNDKSSTCM